jgi:membrane protein YqaA with SNARE-associated domain
VVRAFAWLCVLVGVATAMLGYLMARDDVLVEGAAAWALAPYQLIYRFAYLVTGLYISHDVLELLSGMAGLTIGAFGVGILIGRASRR